ncbi:MAG: integrase/recombinase XerD [Candidatus Latescibacterota bacterium]|jgi:integrase/recombinase XerD
MQMENVTTTLILDTRRAKADKTYPVKISLFCPSPRKQMRVKTKYSFSEADFHRVWNNSSTPPKKFKDVNKDLKALELKAHEAVKNIKSLDYKSFMREFEGTEAVDYSNIFSIYDSIIAKKIKVGAISTAEKYTLSKKCIKAYLGHLGLNSKSITTDKITVDFLTDLNTYCEDTKELSAATIGIYIRNLRAVLRIAIDNGQASLGDYPFSKNGFSIPSSSKVNKALTLDQLKHLWHFDPLNEKQAKAKDFWFFSYYAYGMNTRDVCELKHTSIDDDTLTYVRAKTKNTKKERTQKSVPITEAMIGIIERRKDANSDYLFGVIRKGDTHTQTHEKIKRFNKTINQYFREFAQSAGLDEKFAKQIGTYHARHSFATVSIKNGQSIALISEILHDGNLAVTQSYINSFEKEAFRDLSNQMKL